MYTKSQQQVLEQVLIMGETFFSRDFAGLTIQPRLYPLIVGPTGSGKTFLLKQAAAELNATYWHVTFGDWLPRGVRDGAGVQTTFAILNALAGAKRLVVHIDELDKCREDFDHSWSRSVSNDIWNFLDGILPVEDWLKASGKPFSSELVDITNQRVRESLWIAGSGAWQSVFLAQPRRALGFGAKEQRAPDDSEFTARIRAAKAIPDELLSRFASDLLVLHYPQSTKEKQDLLDAAGLTALGMELGQPVRAEELDLNGLGMRKIESIATRMLLALQRQKGRNVSSDDALGPGCDIPTGVSSGVAAGSRALPPQLILVEEDVYRADACLVSGPIDSPTMITRLRLRRGKSRQGWAEMLVSDPALRGFDEWCHENGLPPLRSPKLAFDLPAPVDRVYLRPVLVDSPATLYYVLRHTNVGRRHRIRLQNDYKIRVIPALSSGEVAECEQFATYCTRCALRTSACSDSESVASPFEIFRQIKTHVWEGSVIAIDWLQKNGDHSSPECVHAALSQRVRQLWAWAIDQAEHLREWDGVTEQILELEWVSQLLAGDSPPRWKALSAEDRLRVEGLFRAEGAPKT
jgi:ATPase family associated with various cellular activities (AAA)